MSTAFDSLEQRLLNLTLAGMPDREQQPSLAVGLFKAAPREDYDGLPGAFGEPALGQSSYARQRVLFPASGLSPSDRRSNTEAISFTGLTPGTYTHFAIFGEYQPYAAYGIAADPTVVFPGSNTPGITAPSQTIPGSSASPSQPAGGFAATVIVEDGLWLGPAGTTFVNPPDGGYRQVTFRGTPTGTNRRGVPRTGAARPGVVDPNQESVITSGSVQVAPGDWLNDNGTGPLLNATTYTPDGDYALGAATGIPPTMEEQGTNIDMYAQSGGFNFGAGGALDDRILHRFQNPLPGSPEHLHSAILARYNRSVNQGRPANVLISEPDLRRDPRGGARRFDVRPQDLPNGVMAGLTFELSNVVSGDTSGTYTTSLVAHSMRCDHVFRTVPAAVAGTVIPGYTIPATTVGGQTIPPQTIPPLVIPGTGRLPVGYVPLYYGVLNTPVTVASTSDTVVVPAGGLTVIAD